jgi:AAA domain/Bifunctional DNA primase/polymerase, N-terminal/Primase C terminal 1 (PriCT-1)
MPKRMSEPFCLTDEMRSNDPIAAATGYINAGFEVVATHGITEKGHCTCGNRRCPHPGKHPIARFFPNGAKSATTKVSLIRKAFTAYPDANLAVTLKGRTVVDIDGPEGMDAMERIGLPKTVRVKTSRGEHWHFDGETALGSFKASQIDVLTGPNRYVMVPPSTHEAEIQYTWLNPNQTHAARVPNTLKQLRAPGKDSRPVRKRKLIKIGERNDTLFRVAASLRRRIENDEAVLAMMKILNEQGTEEPLSESELKAAVASSTRYAEESTELFGPPVGRIALGMEFLWYPYIPRYGVTILAGDPGKGKSLLTSMLVATVTSGLAWPLSSEVPSGNKVLLMSAEDNWDRVTLPRLIKAGANIDNIHVMHKFRALTKERMDALAEEMENWRPDLVVIDTLSAYMGAERDMHRQNEVGEFLAQLTEMAEATGCAVLGIGHLNKQSVEHPLYRIVGSIGFAASIRSALFLGADPNDTDNRDRVALAHGKANASEEGKTMLFQRIGGGREDVPTLEALELSDATATDVCRTPKNDVGRPSNESQKAADFILDFVEDQKPVEWRAVQRSAEVRDIASVGTLNLVRARLAKEGKIRQIGKGPKAKWTLGK